MNKTLIIVDGQFDFIEGGKLPVKGGKQALDNIVDYLNSGEISMVITTQDYHCGKHCSFKEQGGDFPEHCVEGTHGADIYQPILDAIYKNNILWFPLQKGQYLEAFSAFDHRTEGYSHWKEYTTTDKETPYIQFHEDEIIQICGLAGDICVMQTAIALKDINPVIIDNMTASLSDENFRKLADLNNITIIEV
jgi:nicotinamidase/pyrazinamidase